MDVKAYYQSLKVTLAVTGWQHEEHYSSSSTWCDTTLYQKQVLFRG